MAYDFLGRSQAELRNQWVDVLEFLRVLQMVGSGELLQKRMFLHGVLRKRGFNGWSVVLCFEFQGAAAEDKK